MNRAESHFNDALGSLDVGPLHISLDLDDAQDYLAYVSDEDSTEAEEAELEESIVDIATLESWPRPPSWLLLEAVHALNLSTTCRVCRVDGDPLDLLVCDGCGPRFVCHRRCWDAWPEHQGGQGLTMYEPCAKTEFSDWVWINWLLYSKVPREQQEEMHINDIWATWFAVPHFQDHNPPKLYLYPRMQHLVNMQHSPCARQYPSLISFYGETGGGKSTLIRALIRNISPGTRTYPVPVPGNDIDRIKSTSGDVHIYADPETISSEVPLFYADCEGLRGNGLSVATRLVSDASRPHVHVHGQNNVLQKSQRATGRPGRFTSDTYGRRDTVAAHGQSQKRRFDLRWAQLRQSRAHNSAIGIAAVEPSEPRYVGMESRALIVSELYPPSTIRVFRRRLLYHQQSQVSGNVGRTLADFNNNRHRATEKDILSLFEWAKSGHERTLNQRIRPGLVIIVNKDNPNLDPRWLDVNYSTKAFLENFTFSAVFNELIEKWAARGKLLKTAQDLIECYYDSFRVVCIPSLTGTKTARQIARQYKTLYREIRDCSYRLREKKRRVDMNLDITRFNIYLEKAFSKLARDYKSSLDFYYLLEQDSPVPTKFSEHLTATLDKLQNHADYGSSNNVGQEAALVKRLTPYLACCIATQIPHDANGKRRNEILDYFLSEASRGFLKFRDRHWRCEAIDPQGRRRCRNYREGHEKGHQFRANSEDGNSTSKSESIAVGDHICSFDEHEILDALENAVKPIKSTELAITSLSLVAKASGISEILSNRTCLACLSNSPTNILPCKSIQHSICETCLERFDHMKDYASAIILHQCPLGCRFEVPWTIRLKPKTAGARILTLDGGGVRGILELCLLEHLVKAVGHNIPVQELFDLVIGTSTGGIVALGLFKMDWTVTEARQKFKELVREAFSPRQALKIPVFRNAAQLFCSFRYKSSGIENALMSVFGDTPLFGQNKTATADRVKVGVVANTQAGLQPCLFANYSRNLQGSDDPLQREDEIEKDLVTWQAARSTSAAPIYFEPFYHEPTAKSYVDGALTRNNPVRVADEEWRLLWHDSVARPDIVLSVGTGVQIEDTGNARSEKSSKSGVLQALIPRGLKRKVATGFDMVVATLNCNKEWRQYVQSNQKDPRFVSRCHRLDIGLTEKPPKVDRVDEIPNMEREAAIYLRKSYFSYMDHNYANAHAHIQVIARRLIAALFYFVKNSSAEHNKDKDKEYGVLRCRLSPTMDAQFASLIASGPIFRMQETINRRVITQDVIHVARHQTWNFATFSSEVYYKYDPKAEGRVIEVQFPRKSEHWEPISGF